MVGQGDRDGSLDFLGKETYGKGRFRIAVQGSRKIRPEKYQTER